MAETWYLLYDGDSVDGSGEGKHVGRTCDVFAAASHYRKVSKNPHSTGYVQVITDKEVVRYSRILGYNPATLELKEAIQQQRDEVSPQENNND